MVKWNEVEHNMWALPASSSASRTRRSAGYQEAMVAPEQRIRRIERIAHLLDDSFRIPGTGLRFGYDSLIGLIPGVGDVATTLVSLYLIHEARQLGVPKRLLLRMLANSGLDMAVGAIPLVGDIADFAFKANRKNARLLERHLKGRQEKRWQM